MNEGRRRSLSRHPSYRRPERVNFQYQTKWNLDGKQPTDENDDRSACEPVENETVRNE